MSIPTFLGKNDGNPRFRSGDTDKIGLFCRDASGAVAWLRDAGARGDIADVTGRLNGEKVELDFPGRKTGGDLGGTVSGAEPLPADSPVPAGESKLRLLKVSALRDCVRSGEILPGDLLMVFGPEGEVVRSSKAPSSGLGATLFSLRWRRAAGVKVLREPWLPYHYTKRECFIPMRDGVRLYTAIYEPHGPCQAAGTPPEGRATRGSEAGGPSVSDGGVSPQDELPKGELPAAAPIMLMRSPYPVGTYGYGGVGDLGDRIRCFTARGYIIVEQNVRGTYMSEGVFEDVRPVAAGKLSAKDGLSPSKLPAGAELLTAAGESAEPSATDEVTDAYDTIEWLLANTRNNGNVGVYGVSYPGFYATLAALCGHPALKAVSPQAPVTDWWMGDDAHRRGAFMLCDMFGFGGSFFRPKGNPTPDSREPLVPVPDDADLYGFFLGKPVSEVLQPLSELKGFKDIVGHPNYDAFWQERNPLRHLRGIKPAVMVVGGLYDAEDAWGAEHTWKAIKEQSPETECYGVFGPWTHGGWRKDPDFLERIETPFFEYYLEGKGEKPAWRELFIPTGGECPASQGENLAPGKEFPITPGSYISDPANPVPYMDIRSAHRDKSFMWADQRFASARPDVLTQVLAGPLDKELLAMGPVKVRLRFSAQPAAPAVPVMPDSDRTSRLDADLIVKLIDQAPDGTQSLVRAELFPARCRNSFEIPEPLIPGEPTELSFETAGICHRFAEGHSIVLQIQSSLFPLAAMNPQTFLDNPYTAAANDYRPLKVEILPGSAVSVTFKK